MHYSDRFIAVAAIFLMACGSQEDVPQNDEPTQDEGYQFNIKNIQAEYFDSAENRAAYWGIKAFDTTFSFDEDGYSVPDNEKYAGIDFWMESKYGAAYPFKTGKIVFGDTPDEQNYMTCSKCMVLGTDMTTTSYGKVHLAVSGTITINDFSDGKLRATLENVVFKEFEEVMGLNDKGIEVLKEAPLVENGEEITIKKLEIRSDSKDDVFVRDCDNLTDAEGLLGCVNALGYGFGLQK